MSPEEIQLVSALGAEGVSNIFNLILILTGYGAFILGFIIALQFLTIGSWGCQQTCLLVCLITTFTCFSWTVIYVGAVFLEVDRSAFIQTLDQGVTAQALVANKKFMTWQATSSWPGQINLLLSDSIVVWRASALYHQSKFWRFILAILMIANIGINLADCGWISVNESIEFSKPIILDWLSAVLSLNVNITATILFSYKALNHHRYTGGLSGGLALRGTRAQKMLNLLVESGVIFCTIQFIYVIVIVLDAYNIITPNSQWPRHAVDALFVTASACYPVAVIGLLHKNNKRPRSTESYSPPSQNSVQSDDICFSTMRDSYGVVASLSIMIA
ncbi:hypothetical protein BDP27DRAFT_909731 [Rhodocollybia butyracea]|uniref:Uncharacterized protein n=1 Tax=Rhodocollybia butyracea TaxID=206335 RepID=A0A9P5PT60_9AGAR|nr:hypothetical protein BDP27DRAFT_909731 [Rhodocollybia butyracea]